MRFIVSVVSHEHEKMIINFGALKLLSSLENVIVICRDNKPSALLMDYCKAYGVHYIENKSCKGFAENNNLNFNYYLNEIGRRSNDFFLLMNPDIILREDSFDIFKKGVIDNPTSIMTANLYLDETFRVQDHNIRRYPRLLDFASSFLLQKNKTIIDRKNGELPKDGLYWASGSFMSVSVENYLKIRGLDESYYMYCEDIDFCRRASFANISVDIVMDSYVVHTRGRSSHKILSKYFFWHLMGVFKYMLKRTSVLPKKSSIQCDSFIEIESMNESI